MIVAVVKDTTEYDYYKLFLIGKIEADLMLNVVIGRRSRIVLLCGITLVWFGFNLGMLWDALRQ